MSFQCAEHQSSADLVHNSTEPETLSQTAAAFHYHLRAVREPSVLPRVLEMFALRDLIPHHVMCREGAGDDPELFIEVRVHGLVADHARHLAQRMRNIVPMQQVVLEIQA